MITPTRRDFFQAMSAAVVAQTTSAAETGLPTRPLGRTGVRVSVLGLGGAHIGRIREEADSVKLVHTAINEGLTFMDNAWEYNQGRSEVLMGKALGQEGYRKKVFLMTKVCSREYQGAMEQLEDSLKKLQTDVIDLWQFHECNYHNDPDWVFEKGALKAALEAKKQGKIRFIGFTGHKSPAIHRRMLSKPHPWDTAQMPNNVMDSGFLSFREEVMPICLEKGMGIVGMKGCGGDGKMLEAGVVTVEECYRYCLSQPVSVQVVGLSTPEQLERALKIAREFKPMSSSEKQALMSRVKDVMGDGRYELFKTSKRFDSAYHRTQHGFETQGV